MPSGDMKKEYDLYVHVGKADADTTIAKGTVCQFSAADDWHAVVDADSGDFTVLLDAIASTDTDRNVRLLLQGVIEVTSTTAVIEAQFVVASSTGKVKAWTNEAYDKIVGTSLETIAGSGQLMIMMR